MGRVIKWIVMLALVVGLLGAGSYAGARFRVGEVLGPQPPPMGQRTITFGYDSVPGTPGKQLVWTFTWSQTPWTGRRGARMWVSVTGKVLRIQPRNLETLLDQYYRAKEEI